MSASLNICFFIGNLTRDPEVKYTPSGKAVCELGLAINHSYTTDSGEKREEVTFIACECWGRTAEIAGEYLKKGRSVHLQARAKLESWEDKQTGKKNSRVKFVVEKLTLIGSKPTDSRNDDDPPPQQRQRREPAAPPARQPKPPVDPDLDTEDDDIPF